MTVQRASSHVDADSVRQSLLADANRRLYPSLSDPSYLVLRSRRLIFSRWLKRFEGKNLMVLDIGGRYQPYRPLLVGRIDRYIAIDLIKTPLVTVVANGEALPFRPESFDMVIATQVMEYFREPVPAVRQIHAVLKPGGVLLASVAACTPRVVEEELWRFMRPGLLTMLAPFAQVEIAPELYSASSVLRTINLALNSFVRYEAVRAVSRRTVCPIINILGLAFEGLRVTSNDQFTANYSVFAVKG
jgi:SAM-dependent methyltransferase